MINIGIGIGWAKALYSVANNVIANFKVRVLSYPNSIFEAGPCLDATLEELNAIGLLDNASLVITPNAYNEGILYDVVPNTTLGDMDVVRATTATRVNEQGLIEVVPRNLLTYSNTFTNAVWGNAGFGTIAAVIPNNIISPDGLMNGSRITFTTSGIQSRLIQSVPVINGATYRVSIFVKYGNKNTVDLYCDAAVIGLFATFNFTTKAFTAFGVTNPIVTELENGWFRLQYTYIAPSATSQIGFISQNGQDGFIYSYGGQAEIGSSTTEYFPTTTRVNIPRIDYTNGSCPSLLVEPQRTNLIRYSEQFDDATWAKTATTITSNTTISPSGVQNADTITGNGSSGVHDVWQGWTGGTNNSVSFFVKKGTSRYVYLSTSFQATVSDYSCIIVDLDTQTITSNSLGNVGFVSANIVSYANGWYRITSNTTSTISTGMFSFFGVTSTNTFNLSLYGRQVSSSNQTAIVWAGQAEAGSYPTSYIPTVASTVTRNADLISKTGISSLIGQTEGTIFIHFKNNDIDATTKIILKLWDGTDNNRIQLSSFATTLFFLVATGGTTQINLSNSPPISINSKYKLAIKYANNSYKVFINGLNVITSTSLIVPSTSALVFGNNGGGAFFNSINIDSTQLYKTALTDEQCILLTGDTYNSYTEMANSLNYILQ